MTPEEPNDPARNADPLPDIDLPGLKGEEQQKKKKERKGFGISLTLGKARGFAGAKGGAGLGAPPGVGPASPLPSWGIPGFFSSASSAIAKFATPKFVTITMCLTLASVGFFIYNKKQPTKSPGVALPKLGAIRSGIRVGRGALTSLGYATAGGTRGRIFKYDGSVPVGKIPKAGENSRASALERTETGGAVEASGATSGTSRAASAETHMPRPYYAKEDAKIDGGQLTAIDWKGSGKHTKGELKNDVKVLPPDSDYFGRIRGGWNKKDVRSVSGAQAKRMHLSAKNILTQRLWTHEGLSDAGQTMYNNTSNDQGRVEDTPVPTEAGAAKGVSTWIVADISCPAGKFATDEGCASANRTPQDASKWTIFSDQVIEKLNELKAALANGAACSALVPVAREICARERVSQIEAKAQELKALGILIRDAESEGSESLVMFHGQSLIDGADKILSELGGGTFWDTLRHIAVAQREADRMILQIEFDSDCFLNPNSECRVAAGTADSVEDADAAFSDTHFVPDGYNGPEGSWLLTGEQAAALGNDPHPTLEDLQAGGARFIPTGDPSFQQALTAAGCGGSDCSPGIYNDTVRSWAATHP
ncbi:MAG: hypothetical protein WC943_10785 [Elusimicrobiota bacterium]|jgi:hypothetical protein